MDRWITDTPTSARFPVYTRGNADEVGPAPYSPLGWSLTWEQGICPGTADGWRSLGGFSREEFNWPVPETFGNWGGYFYNQVSVGRVLASGRRAAAPIWSMNRSSVRTRRSRRTSRIPVMSPPSAARRSGHGSRRCLRPRSSRVT